jgi:hypothetical protein
MARKLRQTPPRLPVLQGWQTNFIYFRGIAALGRQRGFRPPFMQGRRIFWRYGLAGIFFVFIGCTVAVLA